MNKTKEVSVESFNMPSPWYLSKGKEGKLTIVSNSFRAIDAMNEKDANLIVRAVNSHDALLDALKDAQAVIKQLASEGRFFDDRNRSIGLEGKIDSTIAKAEGK